MGEMDPFAVIEFSRGAFGFLVGCIGTWGGMMIISRGPELSRIYDDTIGTIDRDFRETTVLPLDFILRTVIWVFNHFIPGFLYACTFGFVAMIAVRAFNFKTDKLIRFEIANEWMLEGAIIGAALAGLCIYLIDRNTAKRNRSA